VSFEEQYMSSSFVYENPFMPVSGFHGDPADTNWAGSAADYNDFQLTLCELEAFRLCVQAAANTGNIPDGSSLEVTFDPSSVPPLSTTSSSTEAHTRETSAVPSEGEDILAG
jgi:hypothetical protein